MSKDKSLSLVEYNVHVAYLENENAETPDGVYSVSTNPLIAEVVELPNVWRSLLSHNESQLVDLCVRLAAKLKCLQDRIDYAESCAEDRRFD